MKWQKDFKWGDFLNWNWELGENFAENKNLSLKVEVFQSKFLSWEIGIANEYIKEDMKIICLKNNLI